jgi:sigma-B regulation protein RsbU (phosphoserine phosphatase)
LEEDLPDDRFLTAFMGFLNPQTHEIKYYSGGQGPLLHFHAAEERIEWLQPTHFPVGILEMDDLGESSLLKMEPGDVLALLSDGIYEFNNDQGAEFGEDRVGQLVNYHHRLPMADLSKQILSSVFEFGGDEKQADDITLVLIRRLE